MRKIIVVIVFFFISAGSVGAKDLNDIYRAENKYPMLDISILSMSEYDVSAYLNAVDTAILEREDDIAQQKLYASMLLDNIDSLNAYQLSSKDKYFDYQDMSKLYHPELFEIKAITQKLKKYFSEPLWKRAYGKHNVNGYVMTSWLEGMQYLIKKVNVVAQKENFWYQKVKVYHQELKKSVNAIETNDVAENTTRITILTVYNHAWEIDVDLYKSQVKKYFGSYAMTMYGKVLGKTKVPLEIIPMIKWNDTFTVQEIGKLIRTLHSRDIEDISGKNFHIEVIAADPIAGIVYNITFE